MNKNITNNDKIFLAGHKGLVGSAVLYELKIQNFKKISTISKENLDLRKQYEVDSYLKENKFDAIIIAAAKVGGVLANSKDQHSFLYDNLMIQNNLINSSFNHGINKIIFLGSSCIYPKNSHQPMNENELLKGELEKTNEGYALAKIAGIKLCQYYNIKHDTSYRCLMPTNLYGEKDNYDEQNGHVIPSLIKKFYYAEKNGGNIDVWGSGDARREFLYVKDLASALTYTMSLSDDKFFFNDKLNNSHLNVGTGEDISIKELVQIISKFFNLKGKIVFNPNMPEGVIKKLLDVRRIQSLGWSYSTSMDKGLKNTINYFRKNF